MRSINNFIVLSVFIFSCIICGGVGYAQNCNLGFNKTNGVEYKIIKGKHGKKPETGDVMELTIKLRLKDNKTLDTLFAEPSRDKPVEMTIRKSEQRYNWESALFELSAGDSAVVRVSVDSMMLENEELQFPPILKRGDFVEYDIRVFSILSPEEYKKKLQNAMPLQSLIYEKTYRVNNYVMHTNCNKTVLKLNKNNITI